MANRRNGSSWSLSGTHEGYGEVVDPFKAVYDVRKEKIQGIYQTKGMACSVFVKKDDKEVAYFVTWSGLTKHFNKPAQMNRFSSEHVGEYSGTVDWNSTVATFGHFSFLPAFSIFSSLPSKKVFVIAFKAVQEQEFTSDLEAYCFVGPQKLKLKLEFQRDTRTHKLLTSDTSGKDRKLEWSSVLGAPIIVKNTKISAHNSGARWSVVGVVGLGREGELCPHFVTNTIFEQEPSVHPSNGARIINDTPGQSVPSAPISQTPANPPEQEATDQPSNEARIINDTPGQPVPSDVAQPPISQTPENTTNPPGREAVDASGQPVPGDVAQPPISQTPENTTNPPGGEAVDASDVTLTLTLRLARGGLWAAGTAFILARYSNNPVTMVKLFYLVALPAGVVLRLMVPGSINCILQVNDLNALRTLWQNYQSGLLKKNLEYVLITEDLCKLAKGDEIIMDVFLEEKMYRDVCLELILNQKKGDKVYKEESRQPRRLSYPMREKDKSMFQVYQPPFYHQGCGISPSNQQNDQRIDSKANGHSNAKHANSMQSNSEESLLHSASNVGDVNTIETIFPIELDIDSRSSNGATPLMIAARQGTLDSFIALIERKSDHTLKDNNGCTLLHYAANGGNAVIIDKLLSLGLDIDSRNSDGATPLMIEALEYRLDSFSVLMERKSDPTLKDNNGWTLLHYAAAGDNDVIIEELLSRGLDIDSKNSIGETPLMIAARQGGLDVFRVLIGRKADPTLKDNYGKTLLHYAAEGGNDVIIDKLLSLGLDIDSRNSTGETPLMIAAHEGRLDSFSVLIERKADPTLKNNYGFTLLHYAAKGGNEDIIKKLKIGSLRSTTTTSTKTPQNNDIIG